MKSGTVTKREYETLVARQRRLEQEISLLKEIVQTDLEGERIRPEVIRRLDRLSRELDGGKGRSFSSLAEMRRWLKRL